MIKYFHMQSPTFKHEYATQRFSEIQESAALDILAGLPQEMQELIELLENNNAQPIEELRKYTFNESTALLYKYPPILRDYFDTSQTEPMSVSATFNTGKSNYSVRPNLVGVTLAINCSDGQIIEITCPENAAITEPYAITFVGRGDDLQKASCTVAEVGELICSIILSPTQLADIDEMRRENIPTSSINPRDPVTQPAFQALFEKKADDFSSRQEYNFSIPRDASIDCDIVQPRADGDIKIIRYANGARAYEIHSQLFYSEEGLAQLTTLSSIFEVCEDGGLNKAQLEGQAEQHYSEKIQSFKLDQASVASYTSSLLAEISRLAQNGLDPTNTGRT